MVKITDIPPLFPGGIDHNYWLKNIKKVKGWVFEETGRKAVEGFDYPSLGQFAAEPNKAELGKMPEKRGEKVLVSKHLVLRTQVTH